MIHAAILTALALALADAGAPPAPIPACVQVTTESRYVPYGYNHVVILRNDCRRPVVCHVATDVNPEVQSADVAPGTTARVTTFLGAAASAFSARVGCRAR